MFITLRGCGQIIVIFHLCRGIRDGSGQRARISLSYDMAFLALLLLGILSILFPTLSRFQNSFANLVRNTLLLGLVNLPRTLCVGLITAMSIALCIRFIFPLFFLPALTALLNSLFLEPMFKPYMPPEPVEDSMEEALEDAAE